jgi:ubiquinol-cytochrome c reductase cytochrome c1 subunit
MMMKTLQSFVLVGVSALVIGASVPAYAAGDAVPPPDIQWSFDGPTGTYDKAALQRGYKIYREVCAACHSMKRVAFRNLSALGYSEDQIKAIAAEYTVTDGPNDEGEMFDRPARPSDHFKSPYPNDNAAKSVNNGALPPDLSLITKARHGGADYIYGILTGYEDAPHGHALQPGQHWNKYMPGHVIAMAKPLSDGQVAYEDSTPQTVDQYARDVAHFLTWAAEPEMEARKRMGVKVILFLIVFAGMMYAVKRKIWAKVH